MKENSAVTIVCEVKKRRQRGQILHFTSSEVKQGSECSQ